MSVQTQPFRVVGVNTVTGEDVSVVVEAATKAAAELKAEQMHINTTHIVRLKQETPAPPDEHELFSTEAAAALAGNRTINLIEAVVPPEEPRQAPPPPVAPAPPPPMPSADPVVAAITRPHYNAPSARQEPAGAEVSGLRAFGLVLLVLLGISAGAYFVLVHQPNTINAQDPDLIFGQDLFSDVIQAPTLDPSAAPMRDAFNSHTADTDPATAGPPIAKDQQLLISDTPGKAASAAGQTPSIPSKPSKLSLQSVVTTNQGRFAVINGKLYKQGSNIGSAKLVSVADDWVLIERSGKQFTLKIESNTNQ